MASFTSLVIVESPAKSKTIKKYLGKGYIVLASYGHVRDLLPKEGAVDPLNNFAMKYQLITKNAKHVEALAEAAQKVDQILLATDPDREGEAISFHIVEILKERGLLKNKVVKRVVFHEITKGAVEEALSHPREVSMDLVNAQQARRALDYLVGFNLSPLLWRKVRPGLSAGRVQSPALRMIVERDDEIQKFVAQEYWTIDFLLNKKQDFKAKLTEWQGDKLKQFTLTTEKESLAITKALETAAKGICVVKKVDKKVRKRNPAAPFTTSTLQQEAVRKLGFGAQRTMRIAQQLYEGIDTGQGAGGLITYMRTDSVTLSQVALEDIRAVIAHKFGAEEVPKEPRFYKNKSKNAQEAHEAIRPTDAAVDPESIKHALSPEQYKLYALIWKRTLACQMNPAVIHAQAVDFEAGEGVLRANGSTIAEPGFLRIYEEGRDEPSEDDEESILPPLEVGDKVTIKNITPNQHFTEPPPRFSEATLVKTLEEHGIGRPSTYASIISTLVSREYVLLENKRFAPTDVGRVVNRFLTQYFTQYVDYNFTAMMEDTLDDISRGEKVWQPVLEAFWQPFIEKVKDIQENVQRKDVTHEAMDEKCPECSKALSIRLGKRGRFIGCDGYPECKYTRGLDEKEGKAEPEVVEGRTCPLCESELVIKRGRYGKFIGCSGYPKCKHIEPLEKPKETGVDCPMCKKGILLQRKSRYGKLFYSCNTYPDCTYAVWNWPLNEPCPTCSWPVTMIKTTKRRGTERVCAQKECKFAEPRPEDAPQEET